MAKAVLVKRPRDIGLNLQPEPEAYAIGTSDGRWEVSDALRVEAPDIAAELERPSNGSDMFIAAMLREAPERETRRPKAPLVGKVPRDCLRAALWRAVQDGLPQLDWAGPVTTLELIHLRLGGWDVSVSNGVVTVIC